MPRPTTRQQIDELKAEIAEFHAAGIDGCHPLESNREAYLARKEMLASYYDRWHRELEAAA